MPSFKRKFWGKKETPETPLKML